MKVQIHGKPSFSKDGKSVQVTILVGEGCKRRSEPRHAERGRYGWFGLNTDPLAIPLNARYEDELDTAKNDLASAEVALKDFRKRLEDVEAQTPDLETTIGDIKIKAVKAMLQGLIKTTELEVNAVEAIVDDAKSKLDQVQNDVPLEVEFIGAGL